MVQIIKQHLDDFSPLTFQLGVGVFRNKLHTKHFPYALYRTIYILLSTRKTPNVFKKVSPYDYLPLHFQVEIEHQNPGKVQKHFHSSDLENQNKAPGNGLLFTYLFYTK